MNPWQTQSEADWDGTSPGWLKQGTQYCKYARWKSSSKLRSGKGAQPDSSLPMRHSFQKTREHTVENGQQANKNQRSSFSFNKTANHKISQCTLMAQSPKARLPSMKTMRPIRSQPPAWQWRWKLSPMPSAGVPQEVTFGPHICQHPRWFNERHTFL